MHPRARKSVLEGPFSNLTLPPPGSLEAVRVTPEIADSLIDFRLGIHHKRTVLNDFLIQW